MAPITYTYLLNSKKMTSKEGFFKTESKGKQVDIFELNFLLTE